MRAPRGRLSHRNDRVRDGTYPQSEGGANQDARTRRGGMAVDRLDARGRRTAVDGAGTGAHHAAHDRVVQRLPWPRGTRRCAPGDAAGRCGQRYADPEIVQVSEKDRGLDDPADRGAGGARMALRFSKARLVWMRMSPKTSGCERRARGSCPATKTSPFAPIACAWGPGVAGASSVLMRRLGVRLPPVLPGTRFVHSSHEAGNHPLLSHAARCLPPIWYANGSGARGA